MPTHQRMTALCDLGYSSLDEPVRVQLSRRQRHNHDDDAYETPPRYKEVPTESELYFFVLKTMIGISLVELFLIFFLIWKLS